MCTQLAGDAGGSLAMTEEEKKRLEVLLGEDDGFTGSSESQVRPLAASYSGLDPKLLVPLQYYNILYIVYGGASVIQDSLERNIMSGY